MSSEMQELSTLVEIQRSYPRYTDGNFAIRVGLNVFHIMKALEDQGALWYPSMRKIVWKQGPGGQEYNIQNVVSRSYIFGDDYRKAVIELLAGLALLDTDFKEGPDGRDIYTNSPWERLKKNTNPNLAPIRDFLLSYESGKLSVDQAINILQNLINTPRDLYVGV